MSAPEAVTGRDALVLTPAGLAAPLPLVVEVVDSHGGIATWRVAPDAVGDQTPISVDLAAPASGSPPRNGPATITVSTKAGDVVTANTVIDRSPPSPTLRSVVRGQRVGLTWDAVSAPDPVTYQLERIATGGSWTVVQSGASAGGYTDRDLEPGRYRYRLSAWVPSADGGRNWSGLTATQIRIVAPAPSPAVTTKPTQAKPAATPADKAPAAAAKAKKQPKPGPRQRPRSVAATGTVRGPIPQPHPATPRLEARSTPLIATADEPAVDGAAPPVSSGMPAVATPEVAAPAAPAPQVAAPETAPVDTTAAPLQPFPVTVPPAGALAVQAGTQAPPDAVALLTGLVFLLLTAGVLHRVQGRTREGFIQAWAGRRSARR